MNLYDGYDVITSKNGQIMERAVVLNVVMKLIKVSKVAKERYCNVHEFPSTPLNQAKDALTFSAIHCIEFNDTYGNVKTIVMYYMFMLYRFLLVGRRECDFREWQIESKIR